MTDSDAGLRVDADIDIEAHDAEKDIAGHANTHAPGSTPALSPTVLRPSSVFKQFSHCR